MSSMLTSDSPAFWKGKASTSTTVGSCWVAQFAPQYPKLSASLSTWWVVAPWLKGFEQRALGRKHRSFPWTNWGFFPNPWRTWKWVSFVRRRAPLVFQKFRETENGNSLVGGLEHVWYFPYIGNSNHNWHMFQRGSNHQPPTSCWVSFFGDVTGACGPWVPTRRSLVMQVELVQPFHSHERLPMSAGLFRANDQV